MPWDWEKAKLFPEIKTKTLQQAIRNLERTRKTLPTRKQVLQEIHDMKRNFTAGTTWTDGLIPHLPSTGLAIIAITLVLLLAGCLCFRWRYKRQSSDTYYRNKPGTETEPTRASHAF